MQYLQLITLSKFNKIVIFTAQFMQNYHGCTLVWVPMYRNPSQNLIVFVVNMSTMFYVDILEKYFTLTTMNFRIFYVATGIQMHFLMLWTIFFLKFHVVVYKENIKIAIEFRGIKYKYFCIRFFDLDDSSLYDN